MKILVTGGAGFIGSHLVDRLVKLKYRVVVIDDLSSGKKENINSKAKFYKIDICQKKVSEIFRKEKIGIVFHLAAQKNLRKSVDDPVYDAQINILGSLNLLENCVKYKVKKFIFASTGGAIYGEAIKIPTPETYSAQPTSPYGITKLSIDYYLYFYHLVHGLKYISLRLANVYGTRQDPEGEAGVVAIFIDRILKNRQPVINGDGKQTRDYVYVDDVVKASILALKKNRVGYYNIGTEKETSVNQLFKKIVRISDQKIKEVHGPAKLGEQQRSCLDCQKAKKELSWQPKIDLNQGLRLTYQWFKEKIETLII